MKPKSVKPTPYFIELTIGSTVESLPVIIRKHPKSKRMVLRYKSVQHQVSLTLPRYVTIKQGLHFIQEKRLWIEQQIKEKNNHVPFSDGQIIPILGKKYRLQHVGGRGVIRIENDMIIVPGESEFMARRVREWLKKMAREEIMAIAIKNAKLIGKSIKKISLRDTSSRWGSCSHNGNLSFSWRLMFAPYEILDYVVCHEVAHLRHHDHSVSFWSVVANLCPFYDNAKEWLLQHGNQLYAYG